MKNLFKKSLAFCLVTMLVLTAFVGAFGVSAESATVTAATVEVEAGTTTVTVPVEIAVEDGFYAAYIQVSSDFGALTAVEVPADADYDVTADGYTAVDLATGKILVMSIYGDDLRNDITSATVNCTFTAEAAPAAGSYDVVVTLPDVPAADWAESVVALTAANGAIVVAEEAAPAGPVEYTTVEYDIALNKLSVGYAAPNADFKAALSAGGKATAGRVVQIVADIDGKQVPFTATITTGGGKFIVQGFSVYLMNQPLKLFVRVTNPNTEYFWESNAFEISIADFIADKAATDEKAAAWVALNDAWAAGNETVAVDNAVIEDGVMEITAVSYDTNKSRLSISYAKPSTEFLNLVKGGNPKDGRVDQLVVAMDGKEVKFPASVMSGGGTMYVEGLSLTHFETEIELFLRVSNANTGYLAETNSVKVDLKGAMLASDAAFATAYAALVG